MRARLRSIRIFLLIFVLSFLATVYSATAEGDLIARLKFDGDLSVEGGSYHAVIENDPIFTSFLSPRFGVDGQALHLAENLKEDQADPYVTVAGFSDLISEVSFSFWLRAHWFKDNSSGNGIFSLSTDSGQKNEVHRLHLNQDGTLQAVLLVNENKEVDFTSETPVLPLQENEWFHISYSYSAKAARIQVAVNDRLVIDKPASLEFVHAGEAVLKIGAHATAPSFIGYFDDFRVYDKQLTIAEIRSIINEHAASLKMKRVKGGFAVTISNPSKRTFRVRRSFDLKSWRDHFVSDPTKVTDSFFDPVDPSSKSVFYKIQFPR